MRKCEGGDMSGPIMPIWFAALMLAGLAIPMVGAVAAIVVGLIVKNYWFIVSGIVGGWFYWLLILRHYF